MMLLRVFFCFCVSCLFAVVGVSTPLAPYQTTSLPGTTSSQPDLAGVVLAAASRSFRPIPNPWFVSPEFSGTVDETVVREYATGTLTFYYQVHLNTATGPVMPGFGEYFSTPQVDVDYLVDSSGIGDGSMSARHFGYRELISFSIGQPYSPGPPVLPGTSSKKFFIRTNATAFAAGGLAFLDYNGPNEVGAITTDIFQPVSVPEPGTMAAAAFGILSVCLMRNRKHTSLTVPSVDGVVAVASSTCSGAMAGTVSPDGWGRLVSLISVKEAPSL